MWYDRFLKDKKSIDVKALHFARKVHANEFRHDGSPYINHPIRVSFLVEQYMGKNIEMKAAAFLHDTIENTDTTYNDLVTRFGHDIAFLVLELTTDEDFKKELGKNRYLELRMKNMSDEALIIKLCDRLDNLRDIKCSCDEFIERQTASTLQILTYVIKNRELKEIHFTIMEDILDELFATCKNDEQRVTITNLINSLQVRKKEKSDYIASLTRMKKTQ